MEKKFLLNDQEMRKFIINGYHVVKTSLSLSFHQKVYRQTLDLIQNERPPGNNLLPKIPILADVFTDPVVAGALVSILGPNYVMHPHRACHYHPPQSQEQAWHKDYSIGGNLRCHRGRMAMAFYYPQDVSENMGPTAIQPGTQYYQQYNQMVEGLPLCGDAGTVTIVHYDLWHKATENRSEKIRVMLKFLFCRMEEPQQPSWNAGNTDDFGWDGSSFFPSQHQLVWQHIWQWYLGQDNEKKRTNPLINTSGKKSNEPLFDPKSRTGETIEMLDQAVYDQDESTRLRSLYALGTVGASAIPKLMERFREESKIGSIRNLERADFTNPSQIDTVYGLAAVGKPAVPALIETLDDPDWWIRAAACSSLGCIGQAANSAAPHLLKALNDDSEWVRRNAADALGNTGDTSQVMEEALIKALDDKRETSPWSLSDSPLRENAIASLAKVRPSPAAIFKLREASEDENEYIRAWALIGLSRMRGN